MPLIIFLLITAGQFSCSWRQVCALGDNKDAQMSPLLFRRGATAGIFTLLELPSSIILRESPYAHDSVSPACNQTHSQKLSNASWGCCSLFSRLLDSKIVNHLTTFKLHSQTRVFSANIFSSVVLNQLKMFQNEMPPFKRATGPQSFTASCLPDKNKYCPDMSAASSNESGDFMGMLSSSSSEFQ